MKHLVVLLLVGLLMARVVTAIMMLGSTRNRRVANFGAPCSLLLKSANNLCR